MRGHGYFKKALEISNESSIKFSKGIQSAQYLPGDEYESTIHRDC